MIPKGRLTSGNAPLHIRRQGLSNAMLDGAQTLRTMLANWPDEYQLPADHDIHELISITEQIAHQLVEPDNANPSTNG